ncbi:MAG TPA: CPBP family intramembrane metalloprotease [bacterium]|nr:CPBP family intramembrane metalloprotease [bacterium]
MAIILHKEKISLNLWSLFFFWSIPISFIQEFLYRGFLIYKLKKIFSSSILIILINASLFAFMHIIYEPLALILLLTFVPGLFLSWLSLKFPNLWLLSLSHGILNFFAIWYAFF